MRGSKPRRGSASQTSSTGVAGHFLGDYQGLVAVPDGFGAVFAAARPLATAGPSDIFFARVAPTGGGAARRPLSRRLVLRVAPVRVRAGLHVHVRFRAILRGRPARAVRIDFAGHRLHTDRRGRASTTVRLRSGRRRAHASRRGLRSADAYIVVTRRSRSAPSAVDTR